MKAPPYFPVYPGDINQDERFAFLTNEEFGACFRLLMWQWQNGSVPKDSAKLAAILRVDNLVISRLYHSFNLVFDNETEPGMMRNRWLHEHRENLLWQGHQKSLGGKKGMKRRWSSQTQEGQAPDKIVITTKQNITKQNETETKEKDSSSPPAPHKNIFRPPTIEEVRAYHQEQKYSWEPEAFFDYWQSCGWKRRSGLMKDWKASMRTWNRNNVERVFATRPKHEYTDLSKRGRVV